MVAAVTMLIRMAGKGVETQFAVLGGVLDFLTPFLGELYAILLVEVLRSCVPFFHLLPQLGWADLVAFVASRSFWDLILFLIGGGIGAKVARITVDPENIRGVLSWKAEPIERIAASFVSWDSGL